ncbi:MAG: ATP synthase F0 subunit B, partial [Deltaproteobacteria bacterium]|nr:ATP synthase F0 subunit B [Deltaproteobacteria bacterium]
GSGQKISWKGRLMSGGCSMKRYLISTVLLFSVFFVICSQALSADTAHSPDHATATHESSNESGDEGGHGGDRSADLLDLLYRFLTVALVVILLVVVARKARLTDYLSARITEITKNLEDLQREKEDAEKKCRDMENRLRDFESKRKEIIEEYREEGLAERDRILKEANDRINKIIAQSEASMEQEIRSAKNRLKQEIAEAAVTKAREIIKKEINADDNNDLINKFIEKVRGAS